MSFDACVVFKKRKPLICRSFWEKFILLLLYSTNICWACAIRLAWCCMLGTQRCLQIRALEGSPQVVGRLTWEPEITGVCGQWQKREVWASRVLPSYV